MALKSPDEKDYGKSTYWHVFFLLDADPDLTGSEAAAVATAARRAVDKALTRVVQRAHRRRR